MLKATEVHQFDTEFENTPRLTAGEKVTIRSVEFGKTKKQSLEYALIDTVQGKRFTTGAKVIGQLRSSFYADLIAKTKGKGLDVLVESVLAEPSKRPMLSLNIFNV